MYFDFSAEQYLGRDSARAFLADRLPTSRLRQLLDTDTGFDRALWRGLAELGWMSVLVPESHGGLGLGFLDLALLCEESGRALLPAPLVETAVMLPIALEAGSAAQRDRWLPRIASGDVVATVALAGRDGFPLPAGIDILARPDGAGHVLEGEALLVPFGSAADVMLVAARVDTGDGLVLALIEPADPGVSCAPVPGLDPTMRMASLHLAGVRVDADRIVAGAGRGWPVLARTLRAASTALTLQAIGGAGRVLEMAVEYAKVRHQFGKPIGSFQAIKHKCADMMVRFETTRSGAYHAAWAIATDAPGAPTAAAMAKALCTEMFRFVSGEAIQVHGGIGFTWEHDLHFYFKRAKYLEFALGTPAQHREVVAAALAGGGTGPPRPLRS
jgi:alkylation response protein AidB-like acyl-CoA dehydrogenase